VVVVYIDDILIFTKTVEENEKIMEEVLRQLEENDSFLKPEKCVFNQTVICLDALGVGKHIKTLFLRLGNG
jgi:hypothetical protein